MTTTRTPRDLVEALMAATRERLHVLVTSLPYGYQLQVGSRRYWKESIEAFFEPSVFERVVCEQWREEDCPCTCKEGGGK